MWNYVYRQYGNYNPGGIVINPGYYALAECIVKGTFAGDSLLRWCGVGYDAYEYKKNNPNAVHLYRGEYMSQYSWANFEQDLYLE